MSSLDNHRRVSRGVYLIWPSSNGPWTASGCYGHAASEESSRGISDYVFSRNLLRIKHNRLQVPWILKLEGRDLQSLWVAGFFKLEASWAQSQLWHVVSTAAHGNLSPGLRLGSCIFLFGPRKWFWVQLGYMVTKSMSSSTSQQGLSSCLGWKMGNFRSEVQEFSQGIQLGEVGWEEPLSRKVNVFLGTYSDFNQSQA